MKHNTKTLLPPLTIADLKNLTTVVEERLDTKVIVTKKKQFNQVDLWNINKQRRTFANRRYFK